MIPGVIFDSPADLPQISKDSLVAIAEWNGNVMAVGKMALDARALRDGMKGQAVHVLHTYKDALWALGAKSEPRLSIPLSQKDQPADEPPTTSSAEPSSSKAEPIAHPDETSSQLVDSLDLPPPGELLQFEREREHYKSDVNS